VDDPNLGVVNQPFDVVRGGFSFSGSRSSGCGDALVRARFALLGSLADLSIAFFSCLFVIYVSRRVLKNDVHCACLRTRFGDLDAVRHQIVMTHSGDPGIC
jgi:hypothetical protein